MFEIADECYALENASAGLKAIATGIIGNNNDDAVVRFLIERLKQKKYRRSIINRCTSFIICQNKV